MSDPDQALSAVARGCPRLRNINLAAGFKLGTAENMDCTVLPFVKYCSELSRLVLRECPIGDNLLRPLAIKSRHLKHLDVGGCGKEVTDSAIRMIAVGCPQLRFLDISDSSCSAWALQIGFPELVYLNICLCFMNPNDVLTAIMEGCPKLEHLHGDEVELAEEEEDALSLIIRQMTNLEINWF